LKSPVCGFHCVANATPNPLHDLVPALKGRAKFIPTLRVAFLEYRHF
jgi:hypothetical protein